MNKIGNKYINDTMNKIENEYINNTMNKNKKYIFNYISKLDKEKINILCKSESYYIRYHFDKYNNRRKNKLSRNEEKLNIFYNIKTNGKNKFERLSKLFLNLDKRHYYNNNIILFPFHIWDEIVNYLESKEQLNIRCVCKEFLNINLSIDAQFILDTLSMKTIDLNKHIETLPKNILNKLCISKEPYIVNCLKDISCYKDIKKIKYTQDEIKYILQIHNKTYISPKNANLKIKLLKPNQSKIINIHQFIKTNVDFSFYIHTFNYNVQNKLKLIFYLIKHNKNYDQLTYNDLISIDTK